MAVVGGKHSSVMFYYDPADLLSEGICLALAEKSIERVARAAKIETLPEDISKLSPYYELPLMEDRDLVLFDHFIIMEYLDERFPHPPLLPVHSPVRAHYRSIMLRLKRDLYSLASTILSVEKDEENPKKIAAVEAARKLLRERLISALHSGLDEFQFFASEAFSLLDCMFIPLIMNMESRLGISEESMKHSMKFIKKYKETVFARPGVKAVYSER